MEKAGLKTFVYSFVFSLFTVFGVNGVYLRAHSHTHPEIKIPSKNITLFLKDAVPSADTAAAVPAKKIVLSVLPEIKAQQEEIVDKIPLSVDDFLEQSSETKAVASNQIPLQTSARITAEPVTEQSEKVISNFEKVISSPPPVDENELLPKKMQQQKAAPSSSKPEPAEKEPLYFPENPLQVAGHEQKRPENLLTLPQDEKETPTVAAAKKIDEQPKNAAVQTAEAAPQLLIPLEKDRGRINLAKNEVKTAGEAPANQVALNAKNVPIKSMAAADNRQNAAKKTSDGQWQSMEEKYAGKKSDNPWVVAKGSKFPRNEMVLEDKAYKQDEEEIRKILSGNSQNAGNDQGTIKLASETVKNLLIPIPEEIMKEKNLTPQLVSSNKNKKVEEEMAAKEALRQEEDDGDEETQTDTPADGSTKSGGILNSITSIFSGSKKDVPQIGDSVDNGNESQNSLLSAFTRKKSRSFSKILPTEIRLSFQPNRAEISGQTLKWIRAFAQKTVEEPTTGLEIRIDGTSSPLLQRRRLNLLQNILMNEGADYNKIKTVFTAREPNSFILRTVRINNDNMDMPQNRNSHANSRYQQW